MMVWGQGFVKFRGFSLVDLAGFAELFLKRKLSLPVSRMWQRWVRRSSSAVVIFRVAEDGGPFAEAQVRCDDDAGSFVELAQEMEEQCPSGGAERCGRLLCNRREVAEFVEDDEVGIGRPAGDLSWLSLKLFLFESVDEFDGREEPDTLAVTPMALERWVLPVPGPLTRTTLWASSRNSQR
jgi:hypothetical protein